MEFTAAGLSGTSTLFPFHPKITPDTYCATKLHIFSAFFRNFAKKPIEMTPVFLIGYMGCGKSTLGRNVSIMTGIPFIDLDNYIETRYHATVREIFALHGEAGFREIEQRMLHEVGEFEDVIIACGGGTPCFFDNMDYMNEAGTTVFLDTSLPKLHTRLMRGRHKRPLIADKDECQLREFIVEALEKRRPFYSQAKINFKGDNLETEQQIEVTAENFIKKLGLKLKSDTHHENPDN